MVQDLGFFGHEDLRLFEVLARIVKLSRLSIDYPQLEIRVPVSSIAVDLCEIPVARIFQLHLMQLGYLTTVTLVDLSPFDNRGAPLCHRQCSRLVPPPCLAKVGDLDSLITPFMIFTAPGLPGLHES